MFGRAKVAAITAEFLGTGILTFAVLIALTKGTVPAAFAAGLAVALGVLFFGKVSGAYFNPAVTLGFWTAGKIKTLKAIIFIAAQVVGAFAAFKLFEYVTGNPINANDGDFSGKGLTAEALGAFVLTFAVAVAVFRKYAAGISAAVVGVALAVGVLLGSAGAIGFLNPALALSILGVGSWVWGIYVVGPIIGGIIAVNLYALLFDDERKAFKEAVAEVIEETVATEETVVASKPAVKKTTAAKKTVAKKPTKKTTKK